MVSEASEPEELDRTGRSALRRRRDRGAYRRSVVNSILDEALVCQVAFVADGEPFVLPTAHVRVGRFLYLHGARANHMLRALAGGARACVSVTLVDGLVLARSAFHHALNYRSVVLFGTAAAVSDPGEKRLALTAMVDRLVPGRGTEVRAPTEAELRATEVVRFPIEEGSAKARSGGPVDDPEDLGHDVWAGHVPLGLVEGDPVPDAGIAAPDSLPGHPGRAAGGGRS